MLVSFLDYIINQEGISIDQTKVVAVNKWPTLRTVKELQHFLGLVKFYQEFIWGFNSIGTPLTMLLKKSPKLLSWNPAAKEVFTSAPILRHPDPTNAFMVEIDTSESGVGTVLLQCFQSPSYILYAFFPKKLSLFIDQFSLHALYSLFWPTNSL